MTSGVPSIHPKKRRWARRLALQALYQWQLAQQPIAMIAEQYKADENMVQADKAYFQDILYGVSEHLADLEIYVRRYAGRPLHEIDPIELNILRLATYELVHKMDVPYRVVINEALELEKMFGAAEGYRFVNGTLDKVAREIRYHEVSAGKSSLPRE